MRHMGKILALAALLQLLSITAATAWGEDVPTAKEVMEAQGAPPLIPHRISNSDEGKACLACHEEGAHGAPPTSHPERLTCTQCHIQGETKKAQAAGMKK